MGTVKVKDNGKVVTKTVIDVNTFRRDHRVYQNLMKQYIKGNAEYKYKDQKDINPDLQLEKLNMQYAYVKAVFEKFMIEEKDHYEADLYFPEDHSKTEEERIDDLLKILPKIADFTKQLYTADASKETYKMQTFFDTMELSGCFDTGNTAGASAEEKKLKVRQMLDDLTACAEEIQETVVNEKYIANNDPDEVNTPGGEDWCGTHFSYIMRGHTVTNKKGETVIIPYPVVINGGDTYAQTGYEFDGAAALSETVAKLASRGEVVMMKPLDDMSKAELKDYILTKTGEWRLKEQNLKKKDSPLDQFNKTQLRILIKDKFNPVTHTKPDLKEMYASQPLPAEEKKSNEQKKNISWNDMEQEENDDLLISTNTKTAVKGKLDLSKQNLNKDVLNNFARQLRKMKKYMDDECWPGSWAKSTEYAKFVEKMNALDEVIVNPERSYNEDYVGRLLNAAKEARDAAEIYCYMKNYDGKASNKAGRAMRRYENAMSVAQRVTSFLDAHEFRDYRMIPDYHEGYQYWEGNKLSFVKGKDEIDYGSAFEQNAELLMNFTGQTDLNKAIMCLSRMYYRQTTDKFGILYSSRDQKNIRMDQFLGLNKVNFYNQNEYQRAVTDAGTKLRSVLAEEHLHFRLYKKHRGLRNVRRNGMVQVQASVTCMMNDTDCAVFRGDIPALHHDEYEKETGVRIMRSVFEEEPVKEKKAKTVKKEKSKPQKAEKTVKKSKKLETINEEKEEAEEINTSTKKKDTEEKKHTVIPESVFQI